MQKLRADMSHGRAKGQELGGAIAALEDDIAVGGVVGSDAACAALHLLPRPVLDPGAASPLPSSPRHPPQPNPQAIDGRMGELNAQLNQIADYGEELTKLRERHAMTARATAEAYNRFVVRSRAAAPGPHACMHARPALEPAARLRCRPARSLAGCHKWLPQTAPALRLPASPLAPRAQSTYDEGDLVPEADVAEYVASIAPGLEGTEQQMRRRAAARAPLLAALLGCVLDSCVGHPGSAPLQESRLRAARPPSAPPTPVFVLLALSSYPPPCLPPLPSALLSCSVQRDIQSETIQLDASRGQYEKDMKSQAREEQRARGAGRGQRRRRLPARPPACAAALPALASPVRRWLLPTRVTTPPYLLCPPPPLLWSRAA